jgi:hypothetical protein
MPTPHTEEVEIKQTLIKTLQPTFRRFGVSADTYDDALALLISAWKRSEPWVFTLDTTIAHAIRSSGLLDVIHKHFPPDHAYFFIDLDVMHLISWERPGRERLEAMRAYYDHVLANKTSPIAELEEQVNAGRIAFGQTALEAVRLNLAIQARVLAVLKEESTAIANCRKIIQYALENFPAA